MTEEQKAIYQCLIEAQSILDAEAHKARGEERESLRWASDQIDLILDELNNIRQ